MTDVNKVAPYTIALLVAIVAVAVGAYMFSNILLQTYEETSATNEMHNSSGTVPETVSTTYCDGGILGTTTIDAIDVVTDTRTRLTLDGNYTELSTSACSYNITLVEYINETPDYYEFNYTYDRFTNATQVVFKGQTAMATFADWFVIMVVALVSVIVIGIVMMVGRFGGRP